jgi:signal transduction histidine kinase
MRFLLRAPLLAKLAGANVILALAGGTIAVIAMREGVSAREVLVLFAIGSGIALLVNLALVHLALRPLVELERTADRVWRGDFGARVPPNALADRDIRRTADTMNRLLDGLTGDRERMRTLASQVIRAGDEERARIARELHDSTAQTIAAVKLELTALQSARQADAALHDRLGAIIDLSGMALEEVRTLAHTVHPRVLDDLGLPAALQWLSRRIRDHEGFEIDVELPPRGEEPALGPDEAAVLYRVAQESLRNAARHAGANTVRVRLSARDGGAELEIADDGEGFDLAEAERRRPGMGLFTMRERTALVNGRLAIESGEGKGTTVRAWVPVRK